MSNEIPQLSTFERSCQHWSEQGRVGMDAFYQLATFDYRLLAEELDWREVFRTLSGRFGGSLRLLDVACGSGKFPQALQQYACLSDLDGLRVGYGLLDPSSFSIETARSVLVAPFHPAEEFPIPIQELQAPEVPYPIVWATHALYCVPPSELGVGLARMRAVLDPSGLGFIAHASRDAHYVRFHDLYLQSSLSGMTEPYSTGEQVIEALQANAPETPLESWTITYEGTLDLDDRATAEKYLQRCLFDDTITLERMMADPQLGPYLQGCMDREAHLWRFPQRVWLIFFGALAQEVTRWRRSADVPVA